MIKKTIYNTINKIKNLLDLNGKSKISVNLFASILVLVFFNTYIFRYIEITIETNINPNIEFVGVGTIEDPNRMLFMSLIYFPLFEETIFRLPLSRNKYLQLFAISLAVGLYFTNFYIGLSVFIICCLPVYWFGKIFPINYFIVIVSSILFALYHLQNYSGFNIMENPLHIYIPILLILSKGFGGYCLAILRVRYNIIYSILLHLLFNLFPAFLLFIPPLISGNYLIEVYIFVIVFGLFILSPWFCKYQ
jgi:Type II CAAX prenyl endopeptidase Rce1-like